MRKRIRITGFSDWETMFYNNLLSIPVLTVFSIVVEDWTSDNLTRNLWVVHPPRQCTHSHEEIYSPSDTRAFLLSTIAFSGAAAVGISYTTAWCIRATSSTTYRWVSELRSHVL